MVCFLFGEAHRRCGVDGILLLPRTASTSHCCFLGGFSTMSGDDNELRWNTFKRLPWGVGFPLLRSLLQRQASPEVLGT